MVVDELFDVRHTYLDLLWILQGSQLSVIVGGELDLETSIPRRAKFTVLRCI